MKIFLVEDDVNLNSAIETTFSNLGYEITSYKDGKEAFDNLSHKHDLFIVDINLPNVNGIELVKQIKKIYPNGNVFIISADLNIDTIISAYDLGVTDYIKKPFDIREIIAKIEHTLKIAPKVIHFSNCKGAEYNMDQKIFTYNNTEIKITQKESLLLKILLKNANQYVNNDQIEDFIWGEPFKNGHVRQLVAKLRKKLPCDIIENHTLNGYRVLV